MLEYVELNELNRLFELKQQNELKRMGALFSTDRANYYYDTGTGKVFEIDDDTFFILHNLFFNKSFNIISLREYYYDEKNIEDFLRISVSENLFRAIKPKKLYNPEFYENLEKNLNTKAEQLILKLTDKCNFRCKYCIFNEDYSGDMNFSDTDMSWETAKKAVDYFYKHSAEAKRNAVTFYGGEPLLKFKLLKQVIEYSRELFKDREVSFSFTTNVSLVTDEIADYLTSVPNMSILCSIDGPKEIHDSYRKTVGKKGTFDSVIKGLEKLYKANLKNKHAIISVNAVLTPPYSFEKLDKMEEFFLKNQYLSDIAQITTSYPTDGSIQNIKYLVTAILRNSKYAVKKYNYIDPLFNWQKLKIQDKKISLYKSISFSGLTQILSHINDRYIFNTPEDKYGFHGCCIPGVRRIYVETDGKFYPCERIGISPSIGNVDDGMDIKIIRKYYMDGYSDACIKQCSECWAIRLCNYCYAKRMTEAGFDKNALKDCESKRISILHDLAFYHELMETENGRETLKIIEDVDVI